MSPNFPILPDSAATILAALGLIAIIVYIAASAAEMRAIRRENTIRELKADVRADKTSDKLADCYSAVAHGDPADCDYWQETAELFK